MKLTYERRMTATDLEVRESSDALTFSGYASVFSAPYSMGWYSETVDPGAFKRTLGQNPDVRMLINHDGLALARTASGTLTLDTDAHGLRSTATLDLSNPKVQELASAMRRKDVDQMSFGFRTIEDEWSQDMTTRTMRALDLNDGDVSVVTYPASPSTSAGLRALGAARGEAVTSALAALETRGASDDEVVAVLTRALAAYADGEGRSVLPASCDCCDDSCDCGDCAACTPVSDGVPTDAADVPQADRAALDALELRKARLRLAG